MKIKDIQDENFQDYKKTSMFICNCVCDWKCCKDANIPESVCHNNKIIQQKNFEVSPEYLYLRYKNNPLTSAIVFGGLEPLLQFSEVLEVIEYFRAQGCMDDIVIYTGYYPDEVKDKIEQLQQFKNIIVKFGRFIPNVEPRFDEILGINLVSDNQFAQRIS